MREELTQSRLREILSYDPDTGEFRWREKISRKVVVGKVAGVIENHGGNLYRRIQFLGHRYYAHQLAWLYVYGRMVKLIDHKDLNGLNNAINNLRPATHSENHANQRASRRSISGMKGAHYFRRDGTFSAQITVRGKRHFLGYFDSADKAHEAYKEAASKHFGEFARFDSSPLNGV